MKPLMALLFIFVAGLGAFGYWGLFTLAGKQKYDEMDGMYPGLALLIPALLVLLTLVLFFIDLAKKKKRN